MIFLSLLQIAIGVDTESIKTIYLQQGENYKVNLDSIFREETQNNYSFVQQSNGFSLETSNLKLKSDAGTYSISNDIINQEPTKILRERQLINLEDYQGLGQFGILDEYNSGNRICYNQGDSISLDSCIELDNTANNYDFVFIAKNTIAVSKIRAIDQKFGVTIYQNKQIISEIYFDPSKVYQGVSQTIIEYCTFTDKNYLLFGVTQNDSNIEFLEIQDNLTIVNTNIFINSTVLPNNSTLQLQDIKGRLNKVYLVFNQTNSEILIVSFVFNKLWKSEQNYVYSKDFRALELGYNFINTQVSETYLICQKDYYNMSVNNGFMSNKLQQEINQYAQVKYTLNYLIVLQNNIIYVSLLSKQAQRANQIDGQILKIDVDIQNDILIVFTENKILSFYLQQLTLSYSSDQITDRLDSVQIQAISDKYKQIVNINFQVLSRDNYNLYLIRDLTQNIYFGDIQSSELSVPLNGISGGDIKVDGEVELQEVQITPIYFKETTIIQDRRLKMKPIVQLLLTVNRELQPFYNQGPFLLIQYDDFSVYMYDLTDCNKRSHCLYYSYFFGMNSDQNQKVAVQYNQVADRYMTFALLNSDGLQIQIVSAKPSNIYQTIKIIKADTSNKFVDMKIGVDNLFVYTSDYFLHFYRLPDGNLINKFDLSIQGEPQGELITKLWVNQVKTNLIVITYGEDLLIGRYTTQLIIVTRITIKWVVDVVIIDDSKFVVLSTDKNNLKLTQYIITEGRVIINRDMDTHGYEITGNSIQSDYVSGEIIIQAKMKGQNALLVFGDTELARDSLLKVIQLQDNEFAANIIFDQQQQMLLKWSTDPLQNSSIMFLNNTHQVLKTQFTQMDQEFNSIQDLKYIFKSQFSNNSIITKQTLYLKNDFKIIQVNYPQEEIIYTNEQKLKIPLKPDTFVGQVRSFFVDNEAASLITRFKKVKSFGNFLEAKNCKQVIQFQRVLCVGGIRIAYYNIYGENISVINVTKVMPEIIKLHNLTLNYDGSYALIWSTQYVNKNVTSDLTEDVMLLVYINQSEIQLSLNSQLLNAPFSSSIFYKGWLVLYQETFLNYFKFQVTSIADDQWSLQKEFGYRVFGVNQIEYDPITKQMFYSIGDQNLYYFSSSLDGNKIDQNNFQSCNILQLLQTINIFETNVTLKFIKIITLDQQSFLFASTSKESTLNITIKSPNQQLSVNNLYIVNGFVSDIQVMDDYVLFQSYDYNYPIHYLYKYVDDTRPILSLEGFLASRMIGLFKHEQKIIHVYFDLYNRTLEQCKIDDDMFLTINTSLLQSPSQNISIIATNGIGKAEMQYKITKYKYHSVLNIEGIAILVLVFIVVILIAFIVYFKRKNQKVKELNEQDFLELS